MSAYGVETEERVYTVCCVQVRECSCVYCVCVCIRSVTCTETCEHGQCTHSDILVASARNGSMRSDGGAAAISGVSATSYASSSSISAAALLPPLPPARQRDDDEWGNRTISRLTKIVLQEELSCGCASISRHGQE